jgi:hypothetical protein
VINVKTFFLFPAGLMLGFVVMTGATSAADTLRTPYDITYGNSYERGFVSWYNRSVGISHTLHAASFCREVRYYATDVNNHVYDARLVSACNGSATGQFTLTADVSGGAAYVYVFFYETSPSDINDYVRYEQCDRSRCVPHGPVSATAGFLAAAPAAVTVYPKTTYYVSYGNSYVKGYATWYNESVGIHGELYAAGTGCRSAHYVAYVDQGGLGVSDDRTISSCGGTNIYNVTLYGPVRGGVVEVRVEFYDQNSYRGADLCTRGGCRTV